MTEGNMEFLPFDMVYCILLCLPISSLLRFKSVCKSWLSIIESPGFVDEHVHTSSLKQKLNLILLTRFNRPQQISLLSINNLEEVSLVFPVINSNYRVSPVEIVGSCRGIICLRQHRRVCLWNPATKQCTNLPPMLMVPRQDNSSVGFGFDPKANDYKVVTANLVGDDFVFHIYSLSSDSWRELEGPALPDMDMASRDNTLYRDQICCWLVDTYENHDGVCTFDFTEEVFRGILAPSNLHVYRLFTITENIACAGQLRKKVGELVATTMEAEVSNFSFEEKAGPSTVYEIWMLCDLQVKESWTKLYLVDLDHGPRLIDWMTWVSDDRDFLLFKVGKQLRMYDLVAQQVTNLPFHASDWFEVIVYRESILSIKTGNGAAHGLTSMDSNRTIIKNSGWGDSDVHKAVTTRILLWLPALSLQRFKSVCKSWHSLIQSSDFITQHLSLHNHPHIQDNLSVILQWWYIGSNPFIENSSHHPSYASCTCLISADKMELLDFPAHENSTIETSFNGIICLKNGEDCCLWNPLTKQFKVLCPGNSSNDDGEFFHLGFGFDIKTNNYKVVRFFPGGGSAVQVYCLSTDSWKTIPDEILPTIVSIASGVDAHSRNGICCWLACIDWISRAILSFDFSSEVFKIIPLLDSITSSPHIHDLDVLRDKVVCILLGESYYSGNRKNWNCEIWMMNEYGVTESWVKLCTVGPFSKDLSFMKCYSRKSGDYILLLKDGQLYEYNLVTQDTERVPCQIEGPKDYQVVAYEPSLVPIE